MKPVILTSLVSIATCQFIATEAQAAQQNDTITISTSATYNTRSKSISPTITIAKKLGSFTIGGWVNIRGERTNILVPGLSVKQGQYYTEPAAYTIQDAVDRFGASYPVGRELPGNEGSPYAWDGTRIDGQVISFIDPATGVLTKANATSVVADRDIERPAKKEELGGVQYGVDIRTPLVQDGIDKLLALGVGVKSNGKAITPYAVVDAQYQVSDSIGFFMDAKIPTDGSGADISSGLKINW